jgi:hypothetical protein
MSIFDGEGAKFLDGAWQWRPDDCTYCGKPLSDEDRAHGMEYWHYGMHADCFTRAVANAPLQYAGAEALNTKKPSADQGEGHAE